MNKSEIRLSLIRLGLLQLSIAFILSGVFLALSFKVAVSIVLGALTAIIPHIWFGLKAFQYQGARAAKKIVHAFYKAEALKIILSAVLFTAVFVLCRISAPALFISYSLTLMTQWLAPWIMFNKLK